MSKGDVLFESVPGIRISCVTKDGYVCKGRVYHTASNATAEYMLARRHKYNDWKEMSEKRFLRFRARVMKVFKRYLP